MADDDEARLFEQLQWDDTYLGKAFSVGLERRRERLYLIVRGKLFTPPPEDFFDRLCRFIRRTGDQRLFVELGGCEYLASPFYGMLAEVAAIAHEKGMGVALVNPEKKVYSSLCMLGFGALFEVVEERTTRSSSSDRLRSVQRYRNVGRTKSSDEVEAMLTPSPTPEAVPPPVTTPGTVCIPRKPASDRGEESIISPFS